MTEARRAGEELDLEAGGGVVWRAPADAGGGLLVMTCVRLLPLSPVEGGVLSLAQDCLGVGVGAPPLTVLARAGDGTGAGEPSLRGLGAV